MTTNYYATLLMRVAAGLESPPNYYLGISKTDPSVSKGEPVVNYSRYDMTNIFKPVTNEVPTNDYVDVHPKKSSSAPTGWSGGFFDANGGITSQANAIRTRYLLHDEIQNGKKLVISLAIPTGKTATIHVSAYIDETPTANSFVNRISYNVTHDQSGIIVDIDKRYYYGISIINGDSTPYANVIELENGPVESFFYSDFITNTENIVFSGGKTNYGMIEYYVVYDAPVGGNLLFYGKLSTPQLVLKNESLLFKQGEIKVYVQTKHDYDLSVL